MIVSLGGTPGPILFSLNKIKPEYICFFVSKETKKILDNEIRPNLRFNPIHYDWIVTPNAESLSESYSQLTEKLPDLLEKWEVDPREVCVDYTGGTKTMSVALALATIEQSCCYSYVGGDERSKDGVGVVVNGRERMWFLNNPWDEIAFKERKEVSILFNKARYTSAVEVLDKCITMVSREYKPFFSALKEMVIGYDLWDRFQHSEARTHLYKSREVLTALSSEKQDLKPIVNNLEQNILFLETTLSGGKPSIHYFHDLLANAKRRAELENKFDDGVARLYRAIEVLAQVALSKRYGIDTANVKESSIPESLRGEYLHKYRAGQGTKIRIPLSPAYRLLKELGSELGESFFKRYEKEIRPILDIRNSSILAHGFRPVVKETFCKLLDTIMQFSKTKEDDLPRFPFLKL